jgi:protein ImuB
LLKADSRQLLMTRILCLWLPNWPIQRAIRCRPELKDRPVVLVVNSSRGGEVAGCCGTAASQGVRPGMPLAEAQALARNLASIAYEPSADRRALVRLAEECERFSPRVAVEEDDEPESLLLDISNLEHLWDSEAKLVQQVKKFFTCRGYHVRLAVAETVGAAWAAAHFAEGGRRKGEGGGKDSNDETRMTNEEPAHSSFVIRHSSFNQLPLQALRIADDTAVVLRELGIEKIGQLLVLPREELASRFGDELLLRLDQLTGAGREVIESHRGLPALEAGYALEEPTANRAMLMHVFRRLVDQLARQLAARDQGAVLLMCLLHCGNDQIVPLRVGLLQPSASARQLLELIELHLETMKLPAEVDRVEIRAAVTGRLGERQRELFADHWPSDPYQLALLVNRLSSRLGYDRVLRAELRASPVPERAVRWAVAVGKKDRETRRQGDKESRRASVNKKSPCLTLSLSPCLLPRPLLLYPMPQATEVVCVAPDGPPRFVWLTKRRERIVHCAGPERIETLWWRGLSVRRDYYRVATESGDHLWMFRRLTDGHWFLHGEFA